MALYRIRKYNVLNPVLDSDPFIYRQVGEEQSQGVELDVLGAVTRNWSVAANYAYNDSRVRADADTARIGRRLDNAPLHAAGLWSRADFPGTGFGVGAGLSHMSERVTFQTGLELPGYTVDDVAVFLTGGRVEGMVKVNNLTNERYFVGGSTDRLLFTGVPRSVQVTMRTRF